LGTLAIDRARGALGALGAGETAEPGTGMTMDTVETSRVCASVGRRR
jgi:hypothetical protein